MSWLRAGLSAGFDVDGPLPPRGGAQNELMRAGLSAGFDVDGPLSARARVGGELRLGETPENGS